MKKEKIIDLDFPPKDEYGELIYRKSVACVLTNEKNEVALLYWNEQPWVSFVGGGIDGEETAEEAGRKEILEETGYQDITLVKEYGEIFTSISSVDHKKENRSADIKVLHFKLNSDKQEEIEEKEKQQHQIKWVKMEDVEKEITGPEAKKVFEIFKSEKEERGKIFLISGKHAFASREYFPRLKKEWEEKGFDVEIIDPINIANPNLKENIKNLEKYDFNNSHVITHSMGSSTFLSFLEKNNVKISSLIMIAPSYPGMYFKSTNQDWIENSGYVGFKLDYEKITPKIIGDIKIIYSNESEKKQDSFLKLGKELNAQIFKEENKEHYFTDEYTNEPDFEFKFDEIEEFGLVEEPEYVDINRDGGADSYQDGVEEVERYNVVVIIEHPEKDEFLCAKWKKVDWQGFVTGGIEEGDTVEETALKEVQEETGYQNPEIVKVYDKSSHGKFYHVGKKVNRFAHYRIVHVKLKDLEQKERSEEEKAIADMVWVKKDKVNDFLKREDMKYPWRVVNGKDKIKK